MNIRTRAVVVSTLISSLLMVSLLGLFDSVHPSWTGLINSNPQMVTAIYATTLSIVLLIGTWWVLSFRQSQQSLITIGTFPAVAIFPYVILAESIIRGIFSDFGQLGVAVIASLIIWGMVYLLLLTANVLNVSITKDLPLAQVGRASQFIFALISAYLLMNYMFGAAFPIVLRIVVISTYIFYLVVSNMWPIKIPRDEIIQSAFGITMVMILAVAVLSVWPISAVYTSAIAAVFMYILMNMALETRENIGRDVWVEYSLLLCLIVIVLITNGSWGINGSLI